MEYQTDLEFMQLILRPELVNSLKSETRPVTIVTNPQWNPASTYHLHRAYEKDAHTALTSLLRFIAVKLETFDL